MVGDEIFINQDECEYSSKIVPFSQNNNTENGETSFNLSLMGSMKK